MHNKLMVADNAAAIVGGRNIGDIYYGMNTIANYRDLDVLAAGPVVRDLSGVFDRYWNSPSTVPIAAIVDRAHGADDLDAILVRLREAIAAADYPYPIDQTWTNWRPRAPSFATISYGHTAESSPTTRKPSPAARRAMTSSNSFAGGSPG
jgi:phosphatidylserine/phosphatidylglycerophosphate/cardiolipin synthase-like enzyme